MDMWVSVEPELYYRVYDRLADNPIINHLVGGRVYDGVQDKTEYPYINVGETNVTHKESSTEMYESVAITIHAYSQTLNKYEVKELLKFIGFVLNRPIEIDNYEFQKSRIDAQEVFDDVDQYTKHGVIRLVFVYRHKLKIEKG